MIALKNEEQQKTLMMNRAVQPIGKDAGISFQIGKARPGGRPTFSVTAYFWQPVETKIEKMQSLLPLSMPHGRSRLRWGLINLFFLFI
jgi:hypothetical protein